MSITGTQSFKVVYNRGHYRIQSLGFKRYFKVYQTKAGGTLVRKMQLSVLADNDYDVDSANARYLRIAGNMKEKAFVIENLRTDKSKSNCKQTDVVDLMLDICAGDIQVRMPKADD